MQALASPMEKDRQKPRVSPDWDPTGARLTPTEGFLLSRIDGETPWEQLRLIGGLPPTEVDRCLSRWLSEGIVVVGGHDAPENADPGLESGTDLSDAEQRRILDFEAALDRPYHQVLGVERNADVKTIKRAYFALSREFHPDRHFRRELGSYRKRLEHIFMRIVEAYELLSDPATRAEIERCAEPPPRPVETQPEADGSRADTAPKPPPIDPKRAALERLRSHFRIPQKVLTERQFKAKQFRQAAMVSAKRQSWLEAAASIRLAIAFDPWNDEYKREFAKMQAQVHEARAAELLREADASLSSHAQTEAMRLYEEALSYRPCDPEINQRAALLACEIGELDAAREYAETACEVDPDAASVHCTLGRVLMRMGLLEKAGGEFRRALAIDPDHEETRAQTEKLKRQNKPGRRRKGSQ